MNPSSPMEIVTHLNKRVRVPQARVRFLTQIPFGEQLMLNRYRLGNGLTVLLLTDPSTPVLSYHTWFRVGSRHDTLGKTGLAHLFEHLMFNETKSFAAGAFDRAIEAEGGESNAATWVDWTYYYANLPSSELPLIVRLEADRMVNLVLRSPQVASEKEVVANERRYRVEDDVEGFVSESMYDAAFRHHPYGRPTIGWMSDIQGFTVGDCLRFYRTYYAPNNATIVVVGDVDQEHALGLIQEHYGTYRPVKIAPQERIIEPRQRAERKLRFKRPTPSERISIGFRAPAFGDRDYIALGLANEILFGGRSSRLYRRMVRDQEIAVEVRGALSPFSDPGLYEIWVVVRQDQTAEKALRVLDEELARLVGERVEPDELQKVKNTADLSFLQGLETASGKADRIGFYETVLGDAAQLFVRRNLLKRMTSEDIQRVAKRFIDPKRRTIITVKPGHGEDE